MSIYDGRIPDEQLYDTLIHLIGQDFLWVHKCSRCHPGIRALMATVSPCFEVPWWPPCVASKETRDALRCSQMDLQWNFSWIPMGFQPPQTQPRSVTAKPRATRSRPGNIRKRVFVWSWIKHSRPWDRFWPLLGSSHPILSHLQIYSQITSTDPVSSQAGGYGTSFASEANASTCDDAESQSGAVDFYINLFPLLLMLLKWNSNKSFQVQWFWVQ